MSKQRTDEMNCGSVEINGISISIGKIEENTQVTVKDTGWTEEEKERMEKYGYDSLDIVRAWYS